MSNLNKTNYNKKKGWFKRDEPTANPIIDDNNGDEELLEDKTSLSSHVASFARFIERNHSIDSLSAIKTAKSFDVDYKQLQLTETNDEILPTSWPTLINHDLINKPEYCLSCMGLAMHQTLTATYNDQRSSINKQSLLPIIRAKLINYEPIVQLNELRVNYYGKLVAVRGTVIKAGHVRIVCQWLAFKCGACTAEQVVRQGINCDGSYTTPSKCTTRGCGGARGGFAPVHTSPRTRTVTWQSIKIQEVVGNEDNDDVGRVPRTLECELTEDLVNSCVPGDDVTIIGVIKVQSLPEVTKKDKQNAIFFMYLQGISIVNNKNQTQGSYGASERITFNVKDYYAIQKIHAEPSLFRFLVHSFCPTIYGHEIIKAGLLLALFGGTRSSDGGGARAESHVLMIGDPGLGKSQMLHACTNVAPRGIYVCGNTSTSSGLTVTMTRESGREYALEAGALMLADQGCCCIDEFDKMSAQHACLLEAMEQQTISIAKAGIVCTLPTRATILAAANPAGGHYNKAKTISENLKINSPMLSRFDLIFILLDQPNEQLDMLLSEHVLALHSTLSSSSDRKKSLANDNLLDSTITMSSNDTNVRLLLRHRLAARAGEVIDHLPHSLFRKYIAYAQKYVNPHLCDEAKIVLKQFYLKLRKQFQHGNCTPITTRQLHSLIRLTQARAKVELREEATESDALDVVEIMQASLHDVFSDDVGAMDLTRSQNGTGMSTRNQVVKLLTLLQQRSASEAKSLFTVAEIRDMSAEAGIATAKFYNVLQTLNIQGFLLNKGANRYQLVCADL